MKEKAMEARGKGQSKAKDQCLKKKNTPRAVDEKEAKNEATQYSKEVRMRRV